MIVILLWYRWDDTKDETGELAMAVTWLHPGRAYSGVSTMQHVVLAELISEASRKLTLLPCHLHLCQHIQFNLSKAASFLRSSSSSPAKPSLASTKIQPNPIHHGGGVSDEPRAGEEAYEDLLPVMGERLGTAGLLSELRAGFRLLADPARGAITPESLRRGAAAALGVAGMAPAEADAMVREGDHDGDGALSEAEFCVLMVRLSPGIMGDAEAWLEEAIADELAMLQEQQQEEDPHQAPPLPDDATGTAPAPAGRRSA